MIAMTQKNWMVGGAAAAVLLVGGAWFGAISPEMSHASSVDTQAEFVQLGNSVLTSNIASLKRQEANLAPLQAQLATARLALPLQPEMAAFTREVATLAALSGISVTAMTSSQPSAGGAGTPGSIAGTSSIQVALSLTGTPAHQYDFIDKLQHGGERAVLLTSVQSSTQTATSTAQASLTMSFKVFLAS
jgi:hypothetical protein